LILIITYRVSWKLVKTRMEATSFLSLVWSPLDP
jgi:hypothetical protein